MSEMYDIIEKLCVERGTNITKMCRELNIPRSVFSELKSGRTKALSGKYLAPVADYFDISADYLLSGAQKEKPAAKSDELTMDDFTYALYNESQKLTDEDKEKLLEMAKFFRMQRENKDK